MSSALFQQFYREILSDLSVSREENDEIKQKFVDANPPPDKLIWLRSTAFRIGSDFLTEEHDQNVSLLRSINVIVHALETTCMSPKTDNDDEDTLNEETTEEYYRQIYSDLNVDREESQDLFSFFEELKPTPTRLIWSRAAAFRIASEFLTDDKESNVSLLKCINSIVHAIEVKCMVPKPYELKAEPPEEISINAIGLESSIQQAAQYLWDLDINRLDPGADYKINVQRGKKWGEDGWRQDQGEDPLFVSVDRSAFARPTYKAFIALLNNYTSEVGVKETVSTKERTENWTFLRAIMQTAPMQFCHKYCVENGNDVPQDRDEFMKLLHYIWFKTYTRDRRGEGNDSSGFEHVFVGEIKNGKVSGFHNWINFYFEEKKGNVDYRGYIEKDHQAETNNDDHILTIQFDWNGIRKSIGTSFVGVSPEFEMALYTMCFLVGEENNMLELKTDNDVFTLNCKVYRFGDKISTSFVETKGHKD